MDPRCGSRRTEPSLLPPRTATSTRAPSTPGSSSTRPATPRRWRSPSVGSGPSSGSRSTLGGPRTPTQSVGFAGSDLRAAVPTAGEGPGQPARSPPRRGHGQRLPVSTCCRQLRSDHGAARCGAVLGRHRQHLQGQAGARPTDLGRCRDARDRGGPHRAAAATSDQREPLSGTQVSNPHPARTRDDRPGASPSNSTAPELGTTPADGVVHWMDDRRVRVGVTGEPDMEREAVAMMSRE